MHNEIVLPEESANARVVRRLWKISLGVWIFILTMVVGNFFIPTDKAVTAQMLGHDFLPFYFAGTCARTGQFDKLYDLDATREIEHKIGYAANLNLGTAVGPWWNPPFAAWLFAPFSALSYTGGLRCWWVFGFICLVTSLFLLCRMLQGGWKAKLLVPMYMLTSMPFFQAFSHGQNTFFSLLLLTVTVTLWRANQAFIAGLVCGLLFYKPQLGAVAAIVLSLSQGRRALLGVAITGSLLLAINVITLPGTLHEFLVHMPRNLNWMQEENNYRWERHVTFKGFWRLMIQGWATGPTSLMVKAIWAICEIALLSGLGAVVWKTLRQSPSPSRTDRLISVAIVSMPLLMPFYFDYDLLLVSIGVVVYAADRQRTAHLSQISMEDRWLVRVWVILFITLEFGAMIAGHTRVHPVVPLVSIIAVLLIRRALKDDRQTESATIASPASPVALAA
ncbi:MAG: DUF2029 domain-containing protein [Planctomycetota bacterium]|nr:DUF2029 domain-containing protein [Planctomycetota bacterium]